LRPKHHFRRQCKLACTNRLSQKIT
jgi:hypothetical protein